jgi:hypothetical protein
MAKKRDSQLSGLAGEFFVAAELLKREFQTLVTLGNAKAIDLMAIHPTTARKFSIQVKTLRDPNYFLIDGAKCSREHIYVFVLLNKPGVRVEYFIVPGATLVDEPSRFGKYLKIEKMPGISPEDLKQFEDNWGVFDEPQA